ncbi:MAG: class I SAM-dependent methyltransferase [Pyrinomonadaceae bacterium]|nr:class I SAM-dependent methyltransferase [Pyrinomonadaceae bacterium]
MESECRICGNDKNNRIHTAREMMFGTRETFDYLECGACGTIQIVEIPDLRRHYPESYYSLTSDEQLYIEKHLRRRIAARLAGNYFMKGKNPLGKYLAENKEWLRFNFAHSLREPLLGIDFQSRILDFGCGDGKLLRNLYFYGFHNLTGVDAFIEKDIFYPNGIRIYKRSLAEIDAEFDLIMLHHSFEHLPDPLETLREIHRLLADEKFCLLRIPVANYAWKKYGINWVQLDAPRHLFLYTEKSLQILAEKAGFTVEKIVYDSEEFQFWASEYYAKDIAMNDPNWFKLDFEKSLFTKKQFDDWKAEAEKLNAENQGDQACFYLRKT